MAANVSDFDLSESEDEAPAPTAFLKKEKVVKPAVSEVIHLSFW